MPTDCSIYSSALQTYTILSSQTWSYFNGYQKILSYCMIILLVCGVFVRSLIGLTWYQFYQLYEEKEIMHQSVFAKDWSVKKASMRLTMTLKVVICHIDVLP